MVKMYTFVRWVLMILRESFSGPVKIRLEVFCTVLIRYSGSII